MKRKVLTCGVFDGVHLGHQFLLRKALENGELTVVTFDPHPVQVLQPDARHQMLFDLEDRKQKLLSFGARAVEVLPFSVQFSQKSAEDFRQILLQYGAQTWVLGPDFQFGRGREGSVQWLRQFSDVAVVQAEALAESNGQKISTSSIKDSLRKGDCLEASRMLGRPYELCGQVVHGQKIASGLGFPTANLESTVQFRPRNGVYRTEVSILENLSERNLQTQTYLGVTNVGVRPTVQPHSTGAEPSVHVETHLLNFQGSLYQKWMQVKFLDFLRPEMRFGSLQELRSQIDKDIALVKSWKK